MATTVTNANLTVTITDSVILNGQSYGNTNTLTVANIDEVYSRIVEVPITTYTTLFSMTTAASQGKVSAANAKYFRITNLDDTNYVNLKIADGANATNSFVVKIMPGKSFIMGGVDFLADDSDLGAAPTFNTAMEVQAVANGAAADVEMFIASI
tara:strand:+ start:2337 stop:2798 length:462 start_codon:yes stop_codon:yes gene_type:complete